MNRHTQHLVLRLESVADSLKAVDGNDRAFEATLSTPAVDRYGEVVVPDAYAASVDRLKASGRKLPLLEGHDHDKRRGVWTDLWIDERGLHGRGLFNDNAESLKARGELLSGSLDGVSVGFLADPRKVESRSVVVDGEARRVPHYTQVDLIEASLVTVPANPEAMVRRAFEDLLKGPDDEPVSYVSQADLLAATARIEQAVTRTLQTELSAEPGGRVHHLIREVVAVVRSQGLSEAPPDGLAPHAKAEVVRLLEETRRAIASN